VIRYSASRNSFYSTELDYPNLPDDLVEIQEETYAQLLTAQSSGKQIVPGTDGRPIAQDPTFTDDQLAASARADRDARLAVADNMVNTLEDAGQSSTAWRQYRVQLRDVPAQPGFPRSIQWPVAPTVL
jgi:hypothetical protein